jgi:uncharacterized protein involved in exopolysaccharide biosynthesis
VALRGALTGRIRLIVACTVLAAAAVIPFAWQRRSLYDATAHVAVGYFTLDPELGKVAGLDPHYLVPRGNSIVAAKLPDAWLTTVDSRVATELGRGVNAVAGSVEVKLNANARQLEVVASTRSPRRSAQLANEYADQYISVDRQLNAAAAVVKLRTAIARNTEGTVTPTLRRQAEELAILGGAGPRPLRLVSRAKPGRHRAGIAPWHQILVGGLAGLMIGLTAAVALDVVRRPAMLAS